MRYFFVNESPGKFLRVGVRDVGRDGYLAGSKRVPCLRGRLVDERGKEGDQVVHFAVAEIVEELFLLGGTLKGKGDVG